jgi:hypothetical protein
VMETSPGRLFGGVSVHSFESALWKLPSSIFGSLEGPWKFAVLGGWVFGYFVACNSWAGDRLLSIIFYGRFSL